ncbi:MAG: hypothetical protein CME62_11015 [Halobacteriovoraceae bacterium]|nr:hypothetical protein [Halobacteriovoraceae bacterium]|tara:strand:+ start:5253 stop:6827 length:1575 start_codon:yes stop_codon:yes gene_type:complete
MSYKAGWAKFKMTPFPTNVVMMGWANEKNVAKDHATDLYVRALWIESATQKQIHLYYELGHITNKLFDTIVEKAKLLGLDISKENLFMSANHTHSAPGGLNEHLYYEIPTQGFRADIFELVVDASLKALQAAQEDLATAEITYINREIPHSWEVAFNRQLPAYAQNKEIDDDYQDLDPITTIDRSMPQLNIKKEGKNAVINWFGVHGTCISNRHTSYHFDNKGYACQYMEEYLGADSIALFAQSSAGDVTPNNVFDLEMKTTRGSFELEDKNAQKIGQLQFEFSKKLWEQKGAPMGGDFQFNMERVHFPSLSNENFSLGPACFGVAMLEGTKEGPGIHKSLGLLLRAITRVINFIFYLFGSSEKKTQLKQLRKTHSQKDIIVNGSAKQLFGVTVEKNIHKIVTSIDPLMDKFNTLIKQEPYKSHESWFQEHGHVNVMLWDSMALIAVPFEVTSMSSKRIKTYITRKYPNIKEVIINGYSYAYLGYLTTPEEFDHQAYEGGHTVFGKWSLPLLMEQIDSQLAEIK